MADQYTLGRNAFINGDLSEEEIKGYPPMFRSGYRDAQKAQAQRETTISDLTPEKVVRPEERPAYTLPWQDVMAAAKAGPWKVLDDRPQLVVLAQGIRKNIEARKDELKGWKDVKKMYSQYWEAILEAGIKEGILDSTDLAQFDYTPKAQREA